jgi:pimeloyl-ACP methyl ester carboxylesterase
MADLVVAALSELLAGPVSRRELERGGGRRLRWIEAGGENNPTVVLVAGAGEMALDWANILPVLANRYRIVAYDRAGLGASDPIAPLTLESELEDLVALLANVGPAVVVGHSWGGYSSTSRPSHSPTRSSAWSWSTPVTRTSTPRSPGCSTPLRPSC